MRKLITEILCFVLLLSLLTGCSKESEGEPDSKGEDAEQTEIQDDKDKENKEDGSTESGNNDSGDENSEGGDTTDTDVKKPVNTLSDSIDIIKSMKPSELGLDGDSMDDYTVYANEELVYVDDIPCCRLTVYKHSAEAGTNVIQGMYLLSRDGKSLYQLEINSNTVTEIDMK